MALDNLAFLLPGQRVEDRTQLPACLSKNSLPAPFGHENYVIENYAKTTWYLQSHLEWDRL